MSARKWKPGDVAMVTVDGKELFCTFYDTGVERGWFHGLGFTSCHYVAQAREVSARPLVVIDPEDADALDRLTKALVEAANTHGNKPVAHNGIHPETTALALREFANPSPPKPEEPQGLGAVVEDRSRERWVRVNTNTGTQEWRCCDYNGEFRRWDAIAAVKVLSEGVPA